MIQSVLVTGASGFVCSNIVDVLLEADYSVIAVDRAFDDTLLERWSGHEVVMIEGDAAALPDLCADYLIHGAAITAGPDERGETPEANFRANLEPAIAASEWALAHGVRRSIFISSSGIARTSTSALNREAERYEALGLYSVAKQAVEGLARTLRAEYGRDTLAVRLGYLYGPMEQPRATRPRVSLVAKLVHDALTQGRVTVAATSAPTEWTYVRDLGRAMVALLQAPSLNHALYHLTSGQALSQIDIAHALQLALPDLDIHTTPDTPGFRGVLVGERLEADTGFRDWTDFADGLAETIAWFRRHMELTL